MPTVRFEFADPQATGVDKPAGREVRVALLRPAAVGGRLRSTEAFTVPIAADGTASAELDANGPDTCWYVRVVGVAGVGERWVDVPDEAGPLLYTDLLDVDPRSVPLGRESLPRWQKLQDQLDGLEVGSGAVYTTPAELNAAAPTDAGWIKPANVADAGWGAVLYRDGSETTDSTAQVQTIGYTTNGIANLLQTATRGDGRMLRRTGFVLNGRRMWGDWALLGDVPGNFGDVAFEFMALHSAAIHYPGVQQVRVGTAPLPLVGGGIAIRGVQVWVSGPPVGTPLIVDVNVNGSSIFATPAARPAIPVGLTETRTNVYYRLASGQFVTVDVDQVGSLTPGSHLTVAVVYGLPL